MLRCLTRPRAAPTPLFSAALGSLLLAASAQAQQLPQPPQLPQLPQLQAHETNQTRHFPNAALRGTLVVTGLYEAQLNGKPVRMAPGMRLFSPQNALVMTHTVQGKPLKVNYVTEASTGMLLTAWILTPAEAALPRKGSDTETNVRFEWDTKPAALR